MAAVLGKNGAGKSTLMNVLAGVFSSYGGQIEFGDTAVSADTPEQAAALGIAMIHQELNLVPDMSMADEHPARARTADPPGNRRSRCSAGREPVAEVGLEVNVRRPIRQCRIAEQQLIEVAKSLSLDARLLVMDQPASALADAEVRRLFTVSGELTGRGVAVAYISHRLKELEQIADSVSVMRDGHSVGRRVRRTGPSRSR